MQPSSHRFALMTCVLLIAAGTARAQSPYAQTNLVSNMSGMGPNVLVDPNLQNPWGISFSGTGSPFWISDQAANMNFNAIPPAFATLYSVSGTPPATGLTPPTSTALTVGIMNLGNAPPSPNQTNGPTGQVNTTPPGITTGPSDFVFTPPGGTAGKAAFIFANLDGSISAWKGGLTQSVVQPGTVIPGASFTGLAIGTTSTGAAQLYAADQNSGRIFVFNNQFQPAGTITFPSNGLPTGGLPPGFNTFNVQNLIVNGVQTLFVTYANQATSGGIVAEYSTNGTFIKTLINDQTGVNLNAPWGLAIAPSNFGPLSGDLLVGNNNGPGWIDAYTLGGQFVSLLTLANGQPFAEPDLWSLSFGNGGNDGASNVLYFTSGLASNVDGLFGAISVPEPSSAILGLIAVGMLAGGWRLKNRRRPQNS